VSPVIVVRVLAVVLGSAVVVATLGSAISTVVLPRAASTMLAKIHHRGLRAIFLRLASPKFSFERRDQVMALYAPVALLTLPGVWIAMIVTGFTAIFWGTGVDPIGTAFVTSGSSVFTLGFVRPEGTGRVILGFLEAGLGLGLASLMISYLPSIYGAFRSREMMVGMLESRAGLPPSPFELFQRYHRIGLLEQIDDDLFRPWETWFIDVEESHTSQPALVFFRSPRPDRHWLTAAGCVLDTAALVHSTLDYEQRARAALTIRSGFLCLRRIGDFYGIPYEPDPSPEDPISISRDEYETVCTQLSEAGLPLRPDRDQAWRDFQGWRVNYDAVLIGLCNLVMAPPAKWSSDRVVLSRPVKPGRGRSR
jgi:hypothetical protein